MNIKRKMKKHEKAYVFFATIIAAKNYMIELREGKA